MEFRPIVPLKHMALAFQIKYGACGQSTKDKQRAIFVPREMYFNRNSRQNASREGGDGWLLKLLFQFCRLMYHARLGERKVYYSRAIRFHVKCDFSPNVVAAFSKPFFDNYVCT